MLEPAKCTMLSCLLPDVPVLELGGKNPFVLNGELLSGPNSAWLGMEPNMSQLNPNMSQLNPRLARLNPNLS
jgi:hypothetical protein